MSPTAGLETGGVDQVTAKQAADLARKAAGLNTQDYFQVLNVHQGASVGEIKSAFYKESRLFHPDRFFHITDVVAKDDIGEIYKRVTEAYYVLRDDAKRKKYLIDINGPERAQKLRFNEASEAEQKAEAKKVAEDEFGTHPKARPFFKAALADMDKQNWPSAERNIKLALTYEPGNAKFKAKLAEVAKQIEATRKEASFKIK